MVFLSFFLKLLSSMKTFEFFCFLGGLWFLLGGLWFPFGGFVVPFGGFVVPFGGFTRFYVDSNFRGC